MFCPQCGKEVKEGAAFCSNCGNQMAQGGASANTAPQAPALNYQQPPVQAQGVNQPPVQAGYNQPTQQAGAYNEYQQNGYQQNQYAQGGANPMDPNWIGEPPLMDCIKMSVTKKYVEFKGRATAKEYWYFVLMNCAVIFATYIIGAIISEEFGAILTWLAIIGLALPGLGVSVRRLHDAGHSGWWVLIAGNMIGVIVLGILKTQPFANQYGPVPVYDPITKVHYYK